MADWYVNSEWPPNNVAGLENACREVSEVLHDLIGVMATNEVDVLANNDWYQRVIIAAGIVDLALEEYHKGDLFEGVE